MNDVTISYETATTVYKLAAKGAGPLLGVKADTINALLELCNACEKACRETPLPLEEIEDDGLGDRATR